MASSLPRKCSTTELYGHNPCRDGAGDGNRTHVRSLGSSGSTIELHPRSFRLYTKLVEGGGFEPPKAEPSDLQSDPFGRSGTPPKLAGYSLVFRFSCQQRKRLAFKFFFRMQFLHNRRVLTTTYCRNLHHYPIHCITKQILFFFRRLF